MRTHDPRFILAVVLAAGLVPAMAGRSMGQAAPSEDAPASSQGTAEGQLPVFGAESTAVQLDVVVRDKKGNLVKDLGPEDFEVYEDGKPQAVTGFTFFDAGEAPKEAAESTQPQQSAPQAPVAAGPNQRQANPAVVTFVFDRLSAEARGRAYKAAQDYAKKAHQPGDEVSVFAVGQTLQVIQPFTSDLDQIERGFERAGGHGNVRPTDTSEDLKEKEKEAAKAEELGPLSPADANRVDLLRMERRMLRQYDRLERGAAGYESTNALMALVQGLKPLPGRKTVVFFSEGLSVTPRVASEFQSVIATANRANVSVYAIDVGGLRTESSTAMDATALNQMAAERVRQEMSSGIGGSARPASGGFASDTNQFRGSVSKEIAERNEAMLRNNPRTGLTRLAEETGGFLVADTNDATKGFDRMEQEMHSYYLLSYQPTNAAFDGTYRHIEVKVNRKNMRIQSRNGYLALPPTTSIPVRTYEAPVVAQLDRQPRPSDFPIHARALVFPEAARPGRVPVMVEFKIGAMQFQQVPERKLEAADFAVVARIRDSSGKEIDRLSRDYKIGYPPDKLEQAKAADVLFFEETDLPPGKYGIDAAAYDSVGQRASVVSTTLDVPNPAAQGPRLSSIVLVKRAERLSAEEAQQDNPLYFGQTMLYPLAGEPIHKTLMPALGFYFTVYPAKGEAPPSRAVIEVLKGGRLIAKTGVSLAAPDAGGRIQHAGTLPLSTLQPGTYDLRVNVASGSNLVRQEAAFVIEP